jgi:hypothetical protein
MYSALLPKTRKMKAGPLIMKVINSSGIFQNCYGTIMSLNLPGSQQRVWKGMQTEGWFRQNSTNKSLQIMRIIMFQIDTKQQYVYNKRFCYIPN